MPPTYKFQYILQSKTPSTIREPILSKIRTLELEGISAGHNEEAFVNLLDAKRWIANTENFRHKYKVFDLLLTCAFTGTNLYYPDQDEMAITLHSIYYVKITRKSNKLRTQKLLTMDDKIKCRPVARVENRWTHCSSNIGADLEESAIDQLMTDSEQVFSHKTQQQHVAFKNKYKSNKRHAVEDTGFRPTKWRDTRDSTVLPFVHDSQHVKTQTTKDGIERIVLQAPVGFKVASISVKDLP